MTLVSGFSLVIAGFGALFAGVAAFRMCRMSVLRAHGRRAIGRVVRQEVIRQIGAEQDPYVPVVEFQADNRTLEVKGWGSFPPLYRVGEEVAVYYEATRPENARIVSRREWLIAWLLLGGGLFFLLVAAVVYGSC